MPSPFPGMDPYLERPEHWPNFQQSLIEQWQRTLQRVLPVPFRAIIAVRRGVNLDPDDEGPRPRLPYLEVFAVPADQPRKRVCVVSVLSPFDKVGEGWERYLRWRPTVPYGRANLVELDLLTRGGRLPTPGRRPQGDGYLHVTRVDAATGQTSVSILAWSFRQPLPNLPVPLRPPTSEIWVSLQSLFTAAYDGCRLRQSLDYAGPPAAQLSHSDEVWAAKLAAGNRSSRP